MKQTLNKLKPHSFSLWAMGITLIWVAFVTLFLHFVEPRGSVQKFWILASMSWVTVSSAAQAIAAVLELVAAQGVLKNQFFLIFRASTWGMIKLASWGVFIWIFSRPEGLTFWVTFFGVGTIPVITLIAGIVSYKK